MARNVTVTFNDGTSHVYNNAPDDVTPEAIQSRAEKEFNKPVANLDGGKQKEMSWGEVGSSAARNFIPSAGNLVKGIYEAVSSPLQTAKGVVDIGAGALQNVLPERLVQAIGEDKESRQKASAVADFYKQRYGSMEGFKQALATDPVGVASDVSTVLTGGGTLAAKVPQAAMLAKGLRVAGDVTNPITGAAKLGGLGADVGSAVLGMTTGTGSEAVKSAFKAGAQNKKAFWENMTGAANPLDVLEDAKSALGRIKDERNANYRANKSQYANDATVLKFDDIDTALDDALRSTMVEAGGKRKTKIGEAEQNKINEVAGVVEEWRNDPNFHTVEGLDALKQRIQAIYPESPKQTQAQRVITQVGNAVKSTIQKQAPGYAKTMQNYSEMSDTISEIERALSLGNKAAADTALRKLQSLTRNNVQTNYGGRLKMAGELEKYGADIMPALSGQAMSSWMPRGLVGQGGAIGTAIMNPSAVAYAPAFMPRVVGTTAYGAGQLARGLRGMTPQQLQNLSPQQRRALAMGLYQAGQVTNQGNQ